MMRLLVCLTLALSSTACGGKAAAPPAAPPAAPAATDSCGGCPDGQTCNTCPGDPTCPTCDVCGPPVCIELPQ